MKTKELRIAVERMRNGAKNPLYYACPLQPRGQASADAATIVDAYLDCSDRLQGLIEAYVRMGANAERVGDCSRAASYRAVGNMLGVLLQGGEPVAVDFLARFAEPRHSDPSVVSLEGGGK